MVVGSPCSTVLQSQKAVGANFFNKQLLHIGFAGQNIHLCAYGVPMPFSSFV